MATASISTIGRAVRDHLLEDKMTWEKMMRPAGEKFTPDNQVGYFNIVLRLAGLVKCQLSFNIKMKRFNIKMKRFNIKMKRFNIKMKRFNIKMKRKARFRRRTSHEPNRIRI